MSVQMATWEDTRFEDMREHERVGLEIAVSMESENNFYAGITDNISEGGVFVATHTPPPRGSFVEMKVTLPSSPEPFAIRGRVCWVREASAATEGAPPGCGLQFVGLSPAALRAISRFIQNRDTILYDAD